MLFIDLIKRHCLKCLHNLDSGKEIFIEHYFNSLAQKHTHTYDDEEMGPSFSSVHFLISLLQCLTLADPAKEKNSIHFSIKTPFQKQVHICCTYL